MNADEETNDYIERSSSVYALAREFNPGAWDDATAPFDGKPDAAEPIAPSVVEPANEDAAGDGWDVDVGQDAQPRRTAPDHRDVSAFVERLCTYICAIFDPSMARKSREDFGGDVDYNIIEMGRACVGRYLKWNCIKMIMSREYRRRKRSVFVAYHRNPTCEIKRRSVGFLSPSERYARNVLFNMIYYNQRQISNQYHMLDVKKAEGRNDEVVHPRFSAKTLVENIKIEKLTIVYCREAVNDIDRTRRRRGKMPVS